MVLDILNFKFIIILVPTFGTVALVLRLSTYWMCIDMSFWILFYAVNYESRELTDCHESVQDQMETLRRDF